MRTPLICIFAVLMTSIASSAPKPKAATAPADPLIAEAKKAIADNKLADFAQHVEPQLRAAVSDLQDLDLERITDLAALRQFATYFGKVATADDRNARLMLWLLDQPKLLRTLMMALEQEDQVDPVMTVLSNLRAAEPARLEQLPDLATAVCVVWDDPGRMGPQGPQVNELDRPLWIFRYVAGLTGRSRFDPNEAPWQLQVYTVDNTAGPDEIAWAAKRYAGRGAIGAVYSDVPYDQSALLGSGGKRIDARAYTLQNLVAVGGVCVDQSYFAASVARSVGVPATSVRGDSAMDEGHAWVGFLEVKGKQVRWNFQEGRYPEYNFLKGEVTDPQTRKTITDSDVSLLAELANTKPSDRLASIALVRCADLVPADKLMPLYTRAINLSPGNRGAWDALAALGAQRKISTSDMAAVTNVVAQFAAKQYPDFAFNVLLRMNSGLDTAEQIKALDASRKLFAGRPDLLAQVRLSQANLMREEKRYNDALAAYGQVLAGNRSLGPVLVSALTEIDAMLHETRDLTRLAGIYRQTWQSMQQPRPTAYVRGTPYYKIGQRYIVILREMGQDQEAALAQSRLDALDTTTRTPQKTGGY